MPPLPILDCRKLHANGFGKLALCQTTATADFCQPHSDLSIDVCLNGDAHDTPNAFPMLLDQLIPVGNIARRMDEDCPEMSIDYRARRRRL